MIPSQLEPDAPDSEAWVYRCLAEQLPEDWTVLHGRRIALPAQGSEPAFEGEADFLILDPERGWLAIEVKGGGVERGNGGWRSVDRSGAAHRIKDPGAQASRVAHRIHAFLRERPPFQQPGSHLPFGWGVALPDVNVGRDLGPELPRELVLDQSDMTRIQDGVERIFKAQRRTDRVPAPSAARAFVDALAPRFRLVPLLAGQIDRDRAELVRLTREQASLLDAIEAWPRAAIEGAAGTGKTLLALEKARRLAELGQRVLLLCFNRPLADSLREQADGFHVDSFHGLCHDLAGRAGVAFDVPRDGRAARRFWEDVAPNLLLEAAAALPDERFDALVVDEGQDFREHWWLALEECLAEPGKSALYAFYDPNQDLYGGGPPAALEVAPVRLRWNCRNTRHVAEYAAALVGIDTAIKDGTPDGVPVEEWEYPRAQVPDAVRRLLHGIIAEGGIPERQVVILSTHSPQKSALGNARRLGNFQLVPPDQPAGPGRVRLSSLHRFKGLESDVVILVDVEPGQPTSSDKHLYVGASRARHLLVVVKTLPES